MTEQVNAPKKLPQKEKYFQANGKKYHISSSLSVERWRYYEDFQALVGFGRSFDDIFQNVKKAYEALQHPKIADASVILHNILIGVKEKLDKRHHPALMLCTLFVNYDGEDERVYDEETMNSKIEDWTKEGYDVNDFFHLAWNLVPSFIEAFREDIPDTSSHTAKESSVSKGKK